MRRRTDTGMALVIVALTAVAVGILLAVVGILLSVTRRSALRLQGDLRQTACQAALPEVSALWQAAGEPTLPDPAYPWTQPPGQEVALEADGQALRVVPAGDEAFVYLVVGGEARCVGDRIFP